MEIKDNKIKINTLQKSLVLNWFIFVVIIMIYFLYISWKWDMYNQNKETLTQTIQKYETIEKSWLDYETIKTVLTNEKDAILVLNKMWKEFYDKNLSNKNSPDYLTFLNKKQLEIDKLKLNPEIIARSQKIEKVLPSYAKWVVADWNMSDLQFVNYVETLLKSFNLETKSKIWISDVVSVDEESVWSDKKAKIIDNMSSQIFYIPLSLELEWKKSDIVDFLYFVQNVGVISSINENKINFYSDNVLAWKSIKWQYWTMETYNIYENKIVDISDFSASKYIETSSIKRDASQYTTRSFIDLIRTTDQSNEAYKVTLWLKFYVKGLPLYTLDNFIQNVLKKYKEVLNLSKTTLNSAQAKKAKLLDNNQIDVYSTLKSIDTYLQEHASKSKELEQWIKQKTNLDNLYLKATQFNYDLINIQNVLNLNAQKIKNLK